MPTSTHAQRASALFYLKAGCLLFWALWLGIACTTNLMDFIFTFGGLPADWKFRSNNYNMVKFVVDIYHTPAFVLNLMFISIILYEAFVTILFLLAFVRFTKKQNAWLLINLAFALNIALWGVFLTADEFFIAYGYESTHIALFVFQLINLMAMHLMPGDQNTGI